MDYRLADQLGRELAYYHCRQAGLISDEFCKQAGLLEGILYAPLTSIAALLSAPFGSKLRSMGMGLLLGAGMGAVSQRETQIRNAQGEIVTKPDMSPVMKAILAGVALGGSERVKQDLSSGKQISQLGAMLAGAPLGAMLSDKPDTGLLLGGISGSLISAFHKGQPAGQGAVQNILSTVTGGKVSLPQFAQKVETQNQELQARLPQATILQAGLSPVSAPSQISAVSPISAPSPISSTEAKIKALLR